MSNNKLYWAKIKDNAILPTKRGGDAGYDIYANFEEDFIIIPPHKTVMIPTGIASAFSKDYVAVLKERGSTGTRGIAQRSGIIDSSYRGEWIVPITNTTDLDMIISKFSGEELLNEYSTMDEWGWRYISDGQEEAYLDYGMDKEIESLIYPYNKAICQALILPVPKMECEEITYSEILNMESERGIGKLGSSNK